MKTIKFRKPFQKIKEGEEMCAIVAYAKMNHLGRTQRVDGFRDRKYVSQYKKYLRIDLWLFVIEIDWLTKDRIL